MTTPATAPTAGCIAAQMADAETQWSLGTFGAIAEFARDPDEPVESQCAGAALSAVTARGGIRIEPQPRPAAVRLRDHDQGKLEPAGRALPAGRSLRHERPSRADRAWARRRCAARAGPRRASCSISASARLQVDACVRVSDPAVAAQLRAHCGQPTFAAGNPAGGIILAHSPHRVFISRRRPHRGLSADPAGRTARARKARTPTCCSICCATAAPMPRPSRFPDGFVPCAHLYPAHPAKDAQGRSRPFDPRRHAAFESMLRRFGDPQFVALKERVRAAVTRRRRPVGGPGHRRALPAPTCAWRCASFARPSEDMPSLAAWLAAHERAASARGRRRDHMLTTAERGCD